MRKAAKSRNSYYCYILECADKTLYIGCTGNLKKRLIEHNESRRGARYTRARRPVALKYSERFKTIGPALRREAEIKKLRRDEKLKLLKS